MILQLGTHILIISYVCSACFCYEICKTLSLPSDVKGNLLFLLPLYNVVWHILGPIRRRYTGIQVTKEDIKNYDGMQKQRLMQETIHQSQNFTSTLTIYFLFPPLCSKKQGTVFHKRGNTSLRYQTAPQFASTFG